MKHDNKEKIGNKKDNRNKFKKAFETVKVLGVRSVIALRRKKVGTLSLVRFQLRRSLSMAFGGNFLEVNVGIIQDPLKALLPKMVQKHITPTLSFLKLCFYLKYFEIYLKNKFQIIMKLHVTLTLTVKQKMIF